MRKIFIASIFVLTFCAFAFGQSSNCPPPTILKTSSVIDDFLPVDDFGKLPKKDEIYRLQRFLLEFKKTDSEIAYIILYQSTKKGSISFESRVTQIKKMIEKNKISSERIIFISGGIQSEKLTRLYIRPCDISAPTP